NNGADLYAAVQAAVDQAIAEGADTVIAVGHLGIVEQSSPWRSTDVIANTTGIDAFIDGHSHSVVEGDLVPNKDGSKNVVLTQTGTKLANIGRLILRADGSISTELISGYAAQDEETLAFVGDIESKFAGDLAETIGQTEVTLTVADPVTGNRMVRSQETNL
ncbi:MAG TPA: bifunctional metallophosphatase/5'-nucleotidase, partial [Clostridia bacterium]|nr:bifunctional metallophosphatase/5'-nucleotidase [Clostridia bacterium]